MWSREDRRTLLLLLPLLLLAVAAFVLLEPRASKSSQAARHAPSGAAAPVAELFEFDPNTVDYRQLRRLGFIVPQARSSAYRRILPPAIR